MNELNAKFKNKGLSIVGVTYESAQKTEPWIEKYGVKHAYAYDPGQKLQQWFGINGIPHAVLVDSFGTILWRGHPARLTEEAVESALVGAFPVPVSEWPREAEEVIGLLKAGNLPGAIKASENSPVKLGSRSLADMVRGRATGLVKAIEADFKAQDFLAAQRRVKTAERVLEGLPEATQVAGFAEKLRTDENVRKVLKGQQQLEDLQAQIAKVRKVSEAKKIVASLENLQKKFADTPLGRAAGREAKALRKRIEKS